MTPPLEQGGMPNPGSVRPGPNLDDPNALADLLEQLRARGSRGARYAARAEPGKLAQGIPGRIVAVYDQDLRRELAMKVLTAGESADNDRLASFLREVQVTAQLDHPGIVPVHELGLDQQGNLFFTMKLVVGEDLGRIFEWVRNGTDGWNQTRAVGILLRVAEAVAFAHDRGVVHGNLTPQNVMIGKYAETHVMDWSRARVLGRLGGQDGQEDLHALGELLAGLLSASGSPAELAAIRDQAGARPPARQYAGMHELAADLRAYLEQRVVKAYESGPLAGLRKWVLRNGAATATAAMAMVVILLLTLWFAVNMKRKAAEARASAEQARLATATADANTEQLGRLSDGLVLAELNAELDQLWPSHPAQVAPLRAWLDRARTLLGRLPVHERTLAELRQRGRRLNGPGGEQRFEFEDSELGWWHETLASLVAGLRALSPDDPGRPPAAVRARLEFASSIRQISIDDHGDEWREAIEWIADRERAPIYEGLVIREQLGLVPIGRDPDSGLFEFWHVQTGERPERDGADRLVVTARSGLVLILLPGGTALMGAQAEDPEAPNYDPRAVWNEADADGRPVRVGLDPFLLSKYELTQAQWLRFTGENPSQFKVGVSVGNRLITPLHPVEKVSWEDCAEILHRLDLVIPTEAQWEYAARAGSRTPWWIGAELDLLDRAGNLADLAVRRGGGPASWQVEEQLQDGYVVHAPVGSFRANQFGLHDTIGNVREWCLDELAPYGSDSGSADRSSARNRIFRGGGFWSLADSARSAARQSHEPGARSESLGIRPARALDP